MCFPEHPHAFRHTYDVSGPPETANCAAFPLRTQPKLGIREPTHVASSKEPSVYKSSHVGMAYFTRKFSCDPLHTIVSAQHQAHVDMTAPVSTTVSLLSPMRFASCASTPRTQDRQRHQSWSSARRVSGRCLLPRRLAPLWRNDEPCKLCRPAAVFRPGPPRRARTRSNPLTRSSTGLLVRCSTE